MITTSAKKKLPKLMLLIKKTEDRIAYVEIHINFFAILTVLPFLKDQTFKVFQAVAVLSTFW